MLPEAAPPGAPRRSRKAGLQSKRPSKPELINGRPADQLAEMARRHIGYEIKMLRELAAALRGEGVGPRTMRNALLESFLIHYRNLYDFFHPELRRHRLPGDTVATDYLPDAGRWKGRREQFDKKSSENRERVNAQLAHLTYRRLRYDTRKWPDRAMAKRMEALIDEFVRELPPSRRRWFERVIVTRPAAQPDKRVA
jgi:hypothetical protein